MTFGGLLRHEVTIWREVQQLGSDLQPATDVRGQPVRAPQALRTVRCRIEPLTAREVAQLSQAGPVIADHMVYMWPVDLTTADYLEPEPPDGRRFEVLHIDDGGGAGHHLQVQCRVISSPATPAGEAYS
jgi:hypothetical protein